MRLIGKDCAVQITDGGVQDGSPNWGTAVPIKALAEKIEIDDTVDTTEVTALGDTRKKLRAHEGSTNLVVTLRVQDTGPILLSSLGNYVRLEIKALSSMANYTVYTGLLVGNKHDIPDGAQQQVLTIACDAEV
jgi:hypothetical protein